MTITTYSGFSKRKNSTKQPTSGGTPVTCTLKEGTSIEHPTFVLQSNDFTINYISAFGAYYFVDDIKSVRNNLIEVSCSKDVGATYKSDIAGYTAFIERAASLTNSLLPDPNVAMLNAETVNETTTSVLTLFNPGGFYVISVLNDLGSGAGFTTYYATDILNLNDLAAYVNTDWGSAAANLLDWFQATFLHTADSIIDCIWVPLSLSALTNTSFTSFETFKIGVDTIPSCSGYRFTGPGIISASYTLTIPHQYTDFRKGAPYTIGKLFIPGYGQVEFNPLDFGQDVMNLVFDVDVTTGDAVCFLKNGVADVIACYTYNVAVNCPVGKVGANASGTIGGVLSTAGGIATAIASTTPAGTAAATVGAVSSGINTLATAVAPTASVRGGKGGRALINGGLDIICTTISKYTTTPSHLTATHGNIAMGTATISSLSGYIQCSNASVPIAGESADKDAVNAMLNSGFYYE